MTFTGRITRQGNTTNFGVGSAGAFTRAVSPLGSTLYVFLAGGIVAITDLANGSGTSVVNYQGNPGSSDIGGAFEFGGSLYFTVRGNTDALRRFTDVSTGATENVASLTAEIGACATDGTTVWAYASNTNKLFRFDTSNWSLTEIGDVTFPSGTTENGVQGMFYWAREGRLYIIGGHTDRLYRLPAFADNPSSWTAEAVDATVVSWGVTQAGVAGACAFNGEAYMIGGNPDALYQFVRTIPPLSIEAIDEQSIPILTEDYELEIDIGGEPTRAYVDGDMEGFYHTWDPDDAKIRIKAEKVTRLISGAIWNVHLVRGTETLDARITYNVVPSAPVIADPGAQKLYRGGAFSLDIDIANRPTLARGSALLTGLKYAARADGADGLNIAGRLPMDANLTEAAFNAAIYTENNGGSDNFSVPVTIETHTGVYVFDTRTNRLLKIGPDAATLHWTYNARNPGIPRPGQSRYDPIVAASDGIYLFSDLNDELSKISPDGNLLWTFDSAETGSYEEIFVTESGIYLERSPIYKVHPATGALIWESDIVYSRHHYRVYADDVYVLNRTTRTLTKLNGEDGTVAWTYQTPHRDYSLVRAIGDGVYIARGVTYQKINIADGTEVWTQSVGGRRSIMSFNNDAICVLNEFLTNQYRVLRINPLNGATLWTSNVSFWGSPTLTSDGFYIDDHSSQQRVLKLNLSDGTEAWTVSDVTTLSLLYPNGLYDIGENSETLKKINISDGTQDWSVTVPGIRLGRDLVEDGSDLYALATWSSAHNDLVKLRVSDGSEQWRYEGPESRSLYAQLAIPDFSLGA